VEEHIFDSTEGMLNPVCTIGIAFSHPPLVRSAHDFLDRTFKASGGMQDAEGAQIQVYRPDVRAATGPTAVDAEVLELIDHALEFDRFRLVYQPIVSLQGDARENYAVLVRLLDSNNAEHLPASFLQTAETCGRITEIDRWVIRNAIRELVKQREAGRKVNFFLCLSGMAIEDDSIVLWICDCLREFKAKGAWLAFQFHDEEVRTRIQAARQLIEGLKKINCRIVIDRFDDGPSSETLLRHLPVDLVKLGPAFTRDLASDAALQERLRELNGRLQALGLKTVATSVEDANSLAVLWNTGVNYIQGNFLQEPAASIAYDFEG